MANFCIPQELIEEFKKRFTSGKFNPEKLAEMTSEERHTAFKDIVGENSAKSINALFESKLLLKNQQAGIITWAQKIVGQRPETLRDIVSRVNRMDKVLNPKELDAFLKDLAETKLGVNVTMEEAGKISSLAKDVSESKNRIKDDSPIASKERIEYGMKLALFKRYFGELKLEAEKIPILEGLKTNPLGTMKNIIETLSGTFKSILAAYDNSFFGRQGIKVLYNKPSIWIDNFLKSWIDIGKELKGLDAKTPIQADVWSRPNAINGLYERMKLDIGILKEEAFPSAIPEKIPFFKRLYKASQTAFEGAALRMRADLADSIIKTAKRNEVDLTNKIELQSIGKYVNAMTGRGHLTLTPGQAKFTNATLFSVKLLKSNFDTLTGHQFQKDITPFVRKQAAISTLRIVGTIAAAQFIANTFWPGSVDSKHIGKIKIKGVWVDISGGMGTIAQLAFRIVDRISTQSGKYGELTAMDAWWSFWEGKLSPLAGVLRDILKGEMFGGKKPTFLNITKNLITPIPAQQFLELKDNDLNLGLIILDGLGFSLGIPFKDDWNVNPGKELQQFREKVGQDEFDKANDKFNKEYYDWLNRTQLDSGYKTLSNDDKTKVRTAKKNEIKDKIFKSYGFKYKSTPSPKLPEFP